MASAGSSEWPSAKENAGMELVDPNSSTDPNLSRRAFVAVSVGAAALATSQAKALAVDVTLGQTHAPLVSEDDPAIVVSGPSLDRPGGPIAAYAAVPRSAVAGTPGVVVVQHVWGVDTSIRDVVRRFAKAGYVAVAPELYSRAHAPSGDGESDYTKFTPFASKLVDDQVDGDVAAGATWIRARAGVGPDVRPPKVGVVGFCMGGAIALRASVDCPQFDAAAIWYGKVRQATTTTGAATEMSLAYADEIKMPLLGSYGARDTGIPADDVRALQRVLKVPNDIKIYDEAGHAFFDDQRASYVASAATDSWARALAWFAKYLA
jgi:carboxymethylenebutenolidase